MTSVTVDRVDLQSFQFLPKKELKHLIHEYVKSVFDSKPLQQWFFGEGYLMFSVMVEYNLHLLEMSKYNLCAWFLVFMAIALKDSLM